MPVPQILNALVESALNQALRWSNNGEQALQGLVGKTCIIHLQELDHALCFHFSNNKIDVLADEHKQYCEAPDDLPDETCWVSVSLFALDKLKQHNQLTKLIKAGQLDFTGNLSILQGLSGLFSELEIDFEEVLSRYIGDVAAYKANSSLITIKEFASTQLTQLAKTFSDAALDEKPLGVRPIMLVNFSDEVLQLSADAERFEAKLTLLEGKRKLNNKGSEQ